MGRLPRRSLRKTKFPKAEATAPCNDSNGSCPSWKGYCYMGGWMHTNCKRTCGKCPAVQEKAKKKPACSDKKAWCGAMKGFCDTKSYSSWMATQCASTCGKC